MSVIGSNHDRRATSPSDSASRPASGESLLARMLSNPRLPSPPALALKMVDLVRNPNSTVSEIAELLTHDPALCGKLLKTSNSVLFSPSKPITTINQTVSILGFNRLRSLVLSLSLPAMQSRMNIDAGLKRFWKSSVFGAIVAREIAAHLELPNPEDELVTGLLRDLGMMLIHQTVPDVYSPVWNGTLHLTPEAQVEWEINHLGVDHAEVAAELLSSWRLPMEIWEPIRHHHFPDRVISGMVMIKRAMALEFASRLADLEEEHANPEYMESILTQAKKQFSLERSQLESMLAVATPMVKELAAVMQLDIGACPEFDEVLAAGCEELVRLSVDTDHGSGQRSPTASQTDASKSGGTYDLSGEENAPGGAHVKLSGAPETSLDFLEHLDQTHNRIDGYEILNLLGRGSMGIVYKARDTRLDRFVAIKAMKPEMAGSSRARKRFEREAKAAAHVRHENVVTIYAVSNVESIPFLVMEYIPGLSLQDWLDHGKVFSVDEIVHIGRQIASGLSAAHAMNLIHRDIKPANMLWEDGTGRIRITDFGLARTLDNDPHLTAQGALVGTPLYMSPEQAIGQPTDPMSDMFSLGSLLYALCTGKPPFQGDSVYAILHGVMEGAAPPIRLSNPETPDWLIRAIGVLHAKDQADRMSAVDLNRLLAKHSPA